MEDNKSANDKVEKKDKQTNIGEAAASPIIPDNMILIDGTVLADAINVIHATHGKPIDTYNSLITAMVQSGKFKKQ